MPETECIIEYETLIFNNLTHNYYVMKKQFMKWTALFLSGAMLLNVGCKSYDDDIKDIRNRIDDLTSVTIADLQTQLSNAQSAIAGINKTIEELQSADKANASLMEQLRKDMETADAENAKAIKDAISYLEGLNKKTSDAVDALDKTLGDLSDKVAGLENTNKQSIDEVRNLYKSMSETLDAYKQAQALTDKGQNDKIEELESLLKQLQGNVKTLEDANIVNRMSTVEGILGADIANVLKEAGYSSVSAMIADYVAVKAEVTGMKTNFNASIDAAIAAASDEDNHYKITNVADLKSAIQALYNGIEASNKRIDALQKDLAAQIQSIVSVPEYTDGSFDLTTYTVDGQVVGNSVKLVYRIAPASIAETMVAAGADAVQLLVKEAKTRATAPSAQINSIKAGEEIGTIEIMATIKDCPAGTSVNVALKINNKVRGEEDCLLENDVVSDYAGVVAGAVADYKAVEFEIENVEEVHQMPWNTPKENSLVKPFEDAHIIAKIGEDRYELSDLRGLVGIDFGSVQYKVATVATPASDVFEIVNPAESEFVDFPANAFTVAFAKNLDDANVDNNVVATAQFRVKVGETYANPVSIISKYIVGRIRATFVFGDLQMPWSYKWLMLQQSDMGGYYELQPRPAILSDNFGEVAVSVDEAGISRALFEKIINTGTCVKNQENGVDIPVKISAKTDGDDLILYVSLDAASYEWGKTYNVEYVYTHDIAEYTVKGTVALGAVPADIKEEIMVPMGWADASAIVKLADVYTKYPYGFDDAAEFQSAMLQRGKNDEGNGNDALLIMPATTDNRYNVETKDYDAVVNGTFSSLVIEPVIAVAPAETPDATISGSIAKDAIEADGDSFRQIWKMTTWYGQNVEVVATYNVVLPTSSVFEMVAKDLYIKDGEVKALGRISEVDGVAKWTVETKSEIANYFSWKADAFEDAQLYFKKISKDNDGENGKYYANVNVDDTHNPKIEWNNGVTTEREVEVLAYIGLGARKINVAETEFKVVTGDPIQKFEHDDIATAYVINADESVSVNANLFEGLSIVDADKSQNQWITEDSKLATDKGVFSTVFATQPLDGYQYVDGVNFKIMDNDGFDGFAINQQGQLEYNGAGGSMLLRDINVKIEARIKYWLGEKTETFIVTIKKISF